VAIDLVYTGSSIDLYLFQSLIQELDLERERRWKAEQATLKLVEHVKELQNKGI
jgi:hypothetical protein